MSTTPPTGPDDLAFPAVRPDEPVSVDLDAELHVAKLRTELAGDASTWIHYRQWDVERRLGSGAMGVVYLARHRELGRRVALKILKRTSGDEDVNMARFIREARAMAHVRHDNVLQIYQVDTTGTRAVIEMEYLDGPTMRTWQSEPGRSWREIVAAYASVGDGLSALHRAELVHRDIKPDNLLRDMNGRVKIADLGLAVGIRRTRAEGDDQRGDSANLAQPLTVDGVIVGTPGYMAPEVIDRTETTEASDQFSLATSLYEAVYGVPPFPTSSPERYAAALDLGKLTKPRDGRRRPRWLLRCLQRALHLEPAQRFPTIDDFVRTLRHGLRRRRRWIMGIAAGASLAAITSVAWVLKPAFLERCIDAGAEIDAIWNDTARQEQEQHRLPARAAERPEIQRSLTTLLDTLDARTRSWSDQYTQLCIAQRKRRPVDDTRWSAEVDLDERQRNCLDHSRDRLAAVVNGLRDAKEDLVRHFTDAASAIEALPGCEDRRTLGSWPRTAPDPELERSLIDALTAELGGRYQHAEASARGVVERSRDKEPWLHVEALYRLGHVLGVQRSHALALAVLEEADEAAFAIGHDELLCRTTAFKAKLSAAFDENPERATHELEQARACIHRVGARSPMLHGDLAEAAGLSAHASGDFEEAIRHHREALGIRLDHFGGTHLVTTKSMHNLANSLAATGRDDDADEAHELYRRCLDARRSEHGDVHPEIADVLSDFGEFLLRRDVDRARTLLHDALEIYTSDPESHAVSVARVHLRLAVAAVEASDPDAAAMHLECAAHQHAEHGNDLFPEIDRVHLQHLEGVVALLRAPNMSTAALKRRSYRDAADALRRATSRYRRLSPIHEKSALDCVIKEIAADYGLEDFARIAAIVRDEADALEGHVRSMEPAEDRGASAWYIGDALRLRNEKAGAGVYLRMASATYEGLQKMSEVRQIRHLLDRHNL